MTPLALFVMLTVSQASVRCDETRRIVPAEVKKAVMELRKDLGKRKLHVTDLPSDGVAARRLLEAQMKTHAWCGADAQLRIIRDAMGRIALDKALVSSKIARTAGLSRGLAAKQHTNVENLLDVAQRDLEKGRLAQANQQANDAMFIVAGSRDPWVLPVQKVEQQPQQPTVTAFAAGEELPEKEIAAGCPGFGKGSALTVDAAIGQLGATLDKTQVRAIEIRRGPNLLEQLEQAVRLRDNPKALKTTCVLTYRAGQVSDGLDRTMARFQRVNVLRDKKGVGEPERPQFDSLVKEASRQVAVRDYSGARATLETLLVFLGDPERPSGNLPHL